MPEATYTGDMGKNFPSTTELVRQLETELKRVCDVVPPVERSILNEYIAFALNNRHVIASATSVTPLEILLLLVLIDEHKHIERMEYEIGREIEKLKADLL